METNEDESDPYVALRIDMGNIALKTLKLSTRNNLSLKLDPPMPIPMKGGFFRDWQGIAEIAGYDTSSILELRQSKTPTETLLTHWGQRDNVTIGLLLDALIKLDRFDVIDDLFEQFREYSIIYEQNLSSPDTPKFEYANEIVAQVLDYENAISKVEEFYQNSSESCWDNNNKKITTSDTSITIQRFHAYVCYADEDEPFVRELCKNLDGRFKLCIKDRDLKPGCFEHSAIIELIQERCDKFIIVLSPAFLASPKFHFQTMFAHACSIEERTRKLVPIIYKKCELPKLVSSMAKLDYNSKTFNNFWYRLKKSLEGTEDGSVYKMRESNSFSSLQDESFVSMASSDTSGYSSMYPQPVSESNLSNVSVQSEFMSSEFDENYLQTECMSESELSVNSRKKKKKMKVLKDNVLSMIRKKKK